MNIDDDVRIEKNQDGSETFVFDPYNSLNKEIPVSVIEGILKSYGINKPIKNYELYKRAFIHSSYTRRPDIENKRNNIVIVPKPDDCLRLYTKSNERLEFIGDGVLECITKYYLYCRFSKENEGFMTEKKIALVKNESIGKMAYEMGLHKWFILSKHAESKQTRLNMKKLGCLFEAFIGALFLDFNKKDGWVDDDNWFGDDCDDWFNTHFICGPGFQIVQIFVQNVFEKHVDWTRLVQNDDNFKNILQVKIQKEFKITPDYTDIEEYDIEKGYHMGVYLCLGQPFHSVEVEKAIPISQFKTYEEIHQYMSVYGKILVLLGEGTHKIKKKAEQTACEKAIHSLPQS